MLLTTEINITLDKRNHKRLKKIYDLDESHNVGDNVAIPISRLSLGSHYIVDVTCDYCNKEQKVEYRKYIKSISVCNKFCCSKIECSNQKIKDVCRIKYNVDNPFQSEEVKTKTKKTLKEKYGVEHPMHTESTKTKIKSTLLEKYGVDSFTKTQEYKEKTKKTNLEKYGVEWSLQSEEIREKGKKTTLERYGVEFSSQSLSMREKTIQTCLRKWGYTSSSYSEECKQKSRQTSIERYGVDNPMKSDLFRKNYKVGSDPLYVRYLDSSISLFRCDNLGDHDFEITTSLYLSRKRSSTTLCTICNPINTRCSDREIKLYEYIRSIYEGEVVRNYRDTLEIDIFLPDLNLGIEFNGIYWHSEKYQGRDAHQKKTDYFKEKGIRIIHIWEDDWLENTDIIKSQIRSWLNLSLNKIFARKCEVRIITDRKIVVESLEQWHIQGKDNSIVRLGLYFGDELVSLMTFDKSEGRKKLGDESWNLSRFCTRLNHSVVGGASKLLNFFIKNYRPTRLISYADRCWSTGDLYFKLGFSAVSYTKPDYKYIVKSRRVHKSNFRKSKLKTNKSESEFTRENNIWRIWDCGKIKFEIKL